MSLRRFTFTNGLNDNLEKVVEIDIVRLAIKDIQKLIENQNIEFDVNTIYMRWETTTKVKRACGSKTVYKDNLISFKLKDGEWLKKDLSKTRTI